MAFDAMAFLEALKEIETSKGISKETVISALQDSLLKAFRKELGGEDALVEVNIDPDNGVFEMYHMKNIVEVVEDDFLQISKEDALELAKQEKGFIDGEQYVEPATLDQMRKATALSVKSMMKQKFAEAEKSIIQDAFKDKINTMVSGRVEKADDRGVSITIGRNSVYLPKAHLIGDEKFMAGDPIKVYVSEVDGNSKGAKIVVTRSNDKFLGCLFTEEIHEIFDGTIIIKSIAREAGERSKIAVYSNDPNVDPAGACIGPNGTRIQKIVGQLGNGQAREKIDIIAYSENPGLYVMEALKPAKVAGVIYNAEKKSATVIVKDDSLSLAIGRRGVNARLAVKLTGYNIDIKTESEAIEDGLTYQSFEELEAMELQARALRVQEEAARKYLEAHAEENALPNMPEGYVAPQERVYEDEQDDLTAALEEEVDNEEIRSATKVEEAAPAVEEAPVAEEAAAAPAVEEAPVAPVTEEVAPVVEEKVEVKTTTSLEDLEKNLAADANKGNKFNKKKFSHKKKEEEEEDTTKGITDTSKAERMAIYTEEELAEMAEEEEVEDTYDDEDVDYDQFDEYYDE